MGRGGGHGGASRWKGKADVNAYFLLPQGFHLPRGEEEDQDSRCTEQDTEAQGRL